MSTIVASGGSSSVSIQALDLIGVWTGSYDIYHSSTAAVIGIAGDAEFVFGGTGLGAFDSRGYATTGTITSFSVIAGDLRLDVTDFTISASDLQRMFRHEDSVKFARAIFGGDDTITVGAGGSFANGYWGDDTINGRSGEDHLFGYLGNDTLSGALGDDRLQGDAGADILKGGKGADSFEYVALADSKNGAPDTILDLHNNDLIRLSGIDADTSTPEDDDFVLAGAAFTGNAGELILTFDSPNNRTLIQGDVDGDGTADFTIWATGKHTGFDNFDF